MNYDTIKYKFKLDNWYPLFDSLHSLVLLADWSWLQTIAIPLTEEAVDTFWLSAKAPITAEYLNCLLPIDTPPHVPLEQIPSTLFNSVSTLSSTFALCQQRFLRNVQEPLQSTAYWLTDRHCWENMFEGQFLVSFWIEVLYWGENFRSPHRAYEQ